MVNGSWDLVETERLHASEGANFEIEKGQKNETPFILKVYQKYHVTTRIDHTQFWGHADEP